MKYQTALTSLVSLCITSASFATVWTVDDDGKADFNNIQAAVDAAVDGDEIIVMPGTYTGTGAHVVDMLGKAVWLHSMDGPEVTIVSGQGARQVIECSSNETSNTIIDGFTVTDGYDWDAGGIVCMDSDPTFTNCVISNNTSSKFAGGIYCSDSNAMFTWCVISDNTGGLFGGIAVGGESPMFHDCVISGNIASSGFPDTCGGLSTRSGQSILLNTILCGNTPNQIQGDWVDAGNTCIALSCQDSDGDGWPDKCFPVGDGLHHVPEEYPTIQEAIDAAGDGDEVVVGPGTYTSVELSVIDPRGKRLWIHSSDGADVTILDGENKHRVIVCSSGEINTIIEGFTITRGFSDWGGGMYVSWSNIDIRDCVFHSNTATPYAGAAAYFHHSNSSLENSFVTENTNGNYGVLHTFASDVSIEGCTVSENTGGGVFAHYRGVVSISNTIVCGNSYFNVDGYPTGEGSNCIGAPCIDNDGDGMPDPCVSTGDGVHHVPAEFTSIQNAISAAGNGDEVVVAPGVYSGIGNRNISTRGKDLWIHSSAGPLLTTIDGLGSYTGILCNTAESNNTIIEGFTITNFQTGLRCLSGNPTVIDCVFTDNDSSGLYCLSCRSIDLSRCIFRNNSSELGGGIYSNRSELLLTNCILSGNSASEGGGIYSGFSTLKPTLIGTTVCGNSLDQIHGEWIDEGGNNVIDLCSDTCPDITGNGNVGVADVLAIIDQWGETTSPADINFDGTVDILDLLIVIDRWGACE